MAIKTAFLVGSYKVVNFLQINLQIKYNINTKVI